MALRGWFIVGTVLAVSLSACGSSKQRVVLNTEVSCPSGVDQTKELMFFCTTVGGRGTTRFEVTETDRSGSVHFVAP